MNIQTKATNIEITPSISDYVERKIKMLDKFFANTENVLVNIEIGKTTFHHKSGDVFRAEIKINANGKEYYADVESSDLYAAIDMVKDEMAYSLSSKNKRALHMFRKGGAYIKNMMKGAFDRGTKSWKRFRNR